MSTDEPGKSPEEGRFSISGPVGAVVERLTDLIGVDGGWSVAVPWVRSVGRDSAAENVQRVHEILSANGGRIYQADVGEAADWSEATVSRTLSHMEAEGEIVRIRDGRKKVVCHPDRVPDCRDRDTVE